MISVSVTDRLEVVVEHNIVIVLWHVARQSEVFAEKSDELIARAVVGNLGRLCPHVREHDVEELFAVAPALDTRVDEKVEDGQRFHFDHLAAPASNEQLLVANFEEPDALRALGPHDYDVPIRLQLAKRRDRRRQLLSLENEE